MFRLCLLRELLNQCFFLQYGSYTQRFSNKERHNISGLESNKPTLDWEQLDSVTAESVGLEQFNFQKHLKITNTYLDA